MSISWSIRTWGLAAVIAASLGLAGCGGDGGSSDSGNALLLRNAALAGNGGANGGFDGDPNGGGPRNPGPGTGNPFPFLPGDDDDDDDGTPGQRYFVSSRTDQSVGVFDAETFAQLDEVDVGGAAQGLALDEATGDLFVTLAAGSVAILNTADFTQAPITFSSGGPGVGLGPFDIIFDPTANAIFVTNYGNPGGNNGNAVGVDAATLASFGSGLVPNSAEVAVDRTRGHLYVTSNLANNSSLYILDPDDLSLLTTVDTNVNGDDYADGLAYDDVNGVIYVGNDDANDDDDSFVIIDADNILPSGNPHVVTGGRVTSIAVDNDHNRLYVVNLGPDTLSVYDTSVDPLNPVLLGSPLPAGTDPISVTYEPARERVLVVCQGSNEVRVYDVSTVTPVEVSGSPFPVGGFPYVIVAEPPSITP